MACVNRGDKTKTILVVSEKGIGKRTNLDEYNEETKEWEEIYRITNRGGKGVKTLNISEKTGKLIGFLAVDETDDLFITCVSGVTIRTSVKSIRAAGRATQGVRLINLDAGDSIAAIAKIAEQDEEETIEFDEEGNPIVPEAIVSEEGVENSATSSDSLAPKEDANDNSIAEENPENE
jgi:DNA gyrase subunit A